MLCFITKIIQKVPTDFSLKNISIESCETINNQPSTTSAWWQLIGDNCSMFDKDCGLDFYS